MRHYSRNSPEAAARIVALVLIADGHVCRSEYELLKRIDVSGQLGLPPQTLPQIVQSLCEDLLATAYGSGSMMAHIDEDTLAALMREIDDPALQRSVLDLARAAAQADGHLAHGEELILDAARRHWRPVGGTAAAPARRAAEALL